MPEIKLDLNIDALTKYLENFTNDIVKDIQKSVKSLAIDTHTNIKEQAQNGLHSFRKKYLECLSQPEQIDDNVWMITLSEDAEWIESGRPEPWDMKPGLLKGGKTSKDGHKYRVVPMDQGKNPSDMSSGNKGYEQNMVNKLKSELKKQGIPYKKLELDPATGSPRIGKLHSLDIDSYTPGKGNTPQLHGINIYQHKQKDGSVKRSILTFRTVTDNPDQKDKWIHPPQEAKNFFEKSKAFAESEWVNKIIPSLVEKYSKK